MAKCSTDSDALEGFIEFHKHLKNQLIGSLWCCQSLLKNYDQGIKATRLELHIKSLEKILSVIDGLFKNCIPIVKEELSDYERSQKRSKTKQKGDNSEPKGKVIGYYGTGEQGTQICGGVPPYEEKSEPKELP